MKAEQPKQQALDKCSIKGFVLCSNQRGSAFNGLIRDPRELGVYKKYSSKGVVTLSVRKGFVKETGLLEPFDGRRRVWPGGKRMFQALNYLRFCCYFDSPGAEAACVVIVPGLRWVVQECSTGAAPPLWPSLPQTTKPK